MQTIASPSPLQRCNQAASAMWFLDFSWIFIAYKKFFVILQPKIWCRKCLFKVCCGLKGNQVRLLSRPAAVYPTKLSRNHLVSLSTSCGWEGRVAMGWARRPAKLDILLLWLSWNRVGQSTTGHHPLHANAASPRCQAASHRSPFHCHYSMPAPQSKLH